VRELYALSGRSSAKEVDRRVVARMQRQERLSGGPSPLQLTTVVSQAVLERCVRHLRVAAVQLRKFVDRALWSSIELRALPFDCAAMCNAGLLEPGSPAPPQLFICSLRAAPSCSAVHRGLPGLA
jgi:hypothetical protein